MKGLYTSLIVVLVAITVLNNYQTNNFNLFKNNSFKSMNYTCHYKRLNCLFTSGNCGIRYQHGRGVTLTNQTNCKPINGLVLVGFK